MKKQSGFAAVEFVLGVVILASVIGLGYYVIHNKNEYSNIVTSTSNVAKSTPSYPSVSAANAPNINNASDLTAALNALNQTNVSSSSSDSTQLGTAAAF